MHKIKTSIYLYIINSKSNPLGILNAPVFNIILSILLSFIFSSSNQFEYFLYIFSGLIIFNYYSSCINAGLKVGNENIENFIISRGLRYRDFFFEKNLLIFLEYIINFLIFIFLYQISFQVEFLNYIYILIKFIIYSFLIFVSGISIIYFFYFFSKISLIFSTISSLAMRMLFFATPIFWMPDMMKGFKSLIVDYNPIACSMMILRNFFDLHKTNDFQIFMYLIVFLFINSMSIFLFFYFRKFIRNVK